MDAPDGEAKIKPAALVLPLLHRKGVKAEEDVGRAHLNGLGPTNECRTSGKLCVMHELQVLGLRQVMS